MLTIDQKEAFARDGFLVVPQVLTPEQVKELRGVLLTLFARPVEERGIGDNERFLMDIFARHSQLRWLLFHPSVIEVLRDLLGEDFVVLRESAAHLNGFGGWHKDTTSQESQGQKFQWEKDYLMVEAGFYLQDNSDEYGGGLDVEVGTQLQPDRFLSGPSRLQKLLGKKPTPAKVENPYSVPSRAGDLVIFDFRVNHRATPHRVVPLPPGREKLAIFMACSRNNEHAVAYHQYIATRPGYEYLRAASYPDDLLQSARDHGVNLL